MSSENKFQTLLCQEFARMEVIQKQRKEYIKDIIFEEIKIILFTYLSNLVIFVAEVGSSVNGLVSISPNSDLDLTVFIKRYTNNQDAYFLYRIGKAIQKFFQNQDQKRDKVLQLHLVQIDTSRLGAGVPVLVINFPNNGNPLKVDITLNQIESIQSACLFRSMCLFDYRFSPFVFAVQQWANKYDLMSPINGFNSIALVNMCLQYFQHRLLLPIFKDLHLKMVYELNPAASLYNTNNKYEAFSFLKPLPPNSYLTNPYYCNATVSDLLLDFFEYTSYIDFAKYELMFDKGEAIYRLKSHTNLNNNVKIIIRNVISNICITKKIRGHNFRNKFLHALHKVQNNIKTKNDYL